MRSDASCVRASARGRTGRARALIGTRFRLHGRDPASGIDCVGLIARVIRREEVAPTGYAMRGGTADSWSAMMDAVCVRRWSNLRAGDVLLLEAGPHQFHLGIWSGNGLVHADARLRRVVETPGPLPWPMIGAWGRTKG
jgi:murein DD-endopeptidase / murein LD-carboxypeptidase